MKRNSLIFMLLAALFMPLAAHAQQSLPYSCGWEEDDDFNGWQLYITDQDYSGVYNVESYAHSGTCSLGFYYDEENGYLVSPIFTGGDNGIDGSFWYWEYSNQYGDEQFEVGYTTDESIEDPSEFTYGDVVTASTEWQEYTFSFPAGTKRIAVHYIFNDALILFLDDFEFRAHGAADCPRPTGLTATNVGSRTATLSWTSDASAWQICINGDESNLINTNQTTYPLNNLTPETEYTVKVRANCGNNNFSAWTSVSFTTEVACPAPEVSIGDITANSAKVSWTSDNNRFQLRYRVAPASNDFEEGELGIWTTIDADGDGYDWYTLAVDGIPGHNSSLGIATSASYSSVALTPDNYLVSPRITLGGSISFYACAQDNEWFGEHFGVAVSTNGNINANDFTTIAEWTMTADGTGVEGPARDQSEWGLFTVDLSAYAGQKGYVAIRHFDCTDMFRLNVDDITIVQPGVTEPQPWITDNNASSPKSLTGLTPQTTYQVQVLSDCTSNNDGYSVWTNDYFTTLPTCLAPSNLTVYDITTTDAWLSWDGNASRYILKVNGQQYNNVTSPYHLTSLTPNTEYTIEMQSVCSASSTSTWSTTTFWTACEAFNLPYSYGFDDNNDMNCWSLATANTNNSFGITTLDNNKVFLFSSYNSASSYDQYLVSPELIGTSGVGIDVEFKYRSYNGYGDGETFSVGYSTTTNDIDAFTWGDTISTVSTEWIDYYEALPAGTKYVAVHYYANYQYYLLVDDFNFDVHSDCRRPTDLAVTSFTATSVTLTWTENGEATAWKVQYTAGGRPQNVDATDTEVTITDPDITPGTSIIAKVRPVCDVNNKWSDPITFTIPDVFVNSGRWDVGSNWYSGAVPAEGSDVGIQANVIVPADYSAIANNVSILDGGSITVADGGQLLHQTFGLEVTMQKNVAAFTGSQDNYELVTFPFIDDELEVPADMTLMANDFYLFDNSQAGEEWQNNKANTIDHVELYEGYLYANPTATTLSMTGQTFSTPEYSYGHSVGLYYDETENEVNGWYLLGNPYTSNAYIYGATETSLFAMDVMYYDANGNMQTITCGPVPPMQGFFVKITEDTNVWFLAEEYDLSSKAPLHAVVDKKADNAATPVDKKKATKLKLFNNPSAPFRDFKPFNLLKK